MIHHSALKKAAAEYLDRQAALNEISGREPVVDLDIVVPRDPSAMAWLAWHREWETAYALVKESQVAIAGALGHAKLNTLHPFAVVPFAKFVLGQPLSDDDRMWIKANPVVDDLPECVWDYEFTWCPLHGNKGCPAKPKRRPRDEADVEADHYEKEVLHLD